jgi:hypothetical protein
MTAHCRIMPADERDAPKALAKTGHAFRGQFLDKCATVEHWATNALDGAGQKKRKSYLFGQKIEAVRALACAEPPRFKAPQRVLDLLGELKPFAELRTRLAHSVQTVASTDVGPDILIFTPLPGTAPVGLRLVLDDEDMASLMRDLSRITKELTDQRLKTTPSALLQPKPAEAAGP